MAIQITSDCINCGACAPECPNEAISEGDPTYVINADLCTECVGFHEKEACQAVCPVECCVPNTTSPETEQELIAKALRIHAGDAELKQKAASNSFPSRFRA